MIYESMDQTASTFDKATVVGKFSCVKKSRMLVGDISAQLPAKRREQMLTKLNNPVLPLWTRRNFQSWQATIS